MIEPSGPSGEPTRQVPEGHAPYVAFVPEREGRPVNPNTPEGELRNIAAFAAGVSSTSPGRQLIVKVMVWLVLLGIVLAIIAGVVTGVRTF